MSCRDRVTMSVLPNFIFKFSAIQIPGSYFVDIDRLILQFTWKGKRPKIANTILKDKLGELKLPNFKTHYRTTIIMIV